MSASFVEAATERAMQQRSRVRKVLFLDVDGVLHPVDEKRRPFRSSCMEVFKQIMASEAEIVLSSNWREDKYSCGLLERNLRSNLLPKWVDSTSEGGIFNTRWCVHANAAPVCAACPLRVPSRCRSDEILDWLHRHADVTHFVVLDDVDLCYEDPSVTVPDCVLERTLYVDPDTGLLAKDIGLALAMLDREIDRSSLATPTLMPTEVSPTPDTASSMR
eukprot:4965737-Prymnesium_polylepis.1